MLVERLAGGWLGNYGPHPWMLLAPLAAHRTLELVGQYALPIPMTVICELMGVPAELDKTYGFKPAGRFVADVITALIDAADVGVNLLELDALAQPGEEAAGQEPEVQDRLPWVARPGAERDADGK